MMLPQALGQWLQTCYPALASKASQTAVAICCWERLSLSQINKLRLSCSLTCLRAESWWELEFKPLFVRFQSSPSPALPEESQAASH